MLEARAEDMRELIPVPLKAFILAISTDDEELQELEEDLQIMGCEGLLAKPWSIRAEDILREFRFERRNQWIGTKRSDLDHWTPDTWARVYGFPRGSGEGWAGRKDGMFTKKFRGDADPKEGLHPSNCRNHIERRVLEFLMPILNSENPKRITLTMANTLFGAMSAVRARELEVANSLCSRKGYPPYRAETLLPLPSFCTSTSTSTTSQLMRRTY